jgi:transcriptional regulator with XRE-family HTH domain
MDLIKFGNNVRIERNKLRYSQEELAGLIGTQQSHIGKIERGEADIRISTLIAIMKALNVPFEKLYDMKEE